MANNFDWSEAEGRLSLVSQGVSEISEFMLPPKLALDRVQTVDLMDNQLRTIPSFLSRMPALRTLVLDNNVIDESCEWPPLTQLETLWVNGNRIQDLRLFLDHVTRACPRLSYLSLLKNPACPSPLIGRDLDDYQRYRLYVLHRLPQLRFLDSSPVQETERAEAARVGHLQLPARPSTSSSSPLPPPPDQPAEPPLPADLAEPGVGSVTFGRSKYIYHGKQSEGNRFILNSDL